MEMKLTLPDEVAGKLGEEPEREVLEGVLLLLVGEGRLSLEKAGEVLGFENGEDAGRWYAERSRSGTDDEGEAELEFLNLEDLTQEELDRSERFLRITPARKGSGFSDVSVNHDKYLYGDD
ncbi:MAG: hypothetical protein ACRDSJ_25150 [Rubrobacteraceae bacterium]